MVQAIYDRLVCFIHGHAWGKWRVAVGFTRNGHKLKRRECLRCGAIDLMEAGATE